jgi:hypothetical protein
MRGKNAVLTVTVAIALGAAGGRLANASNHESSRDRDGGYLIPGGTADGVNPVHHPEYFGSPADTNCFERFKTYDWASGTYLGRDGRRHPCRVR